MDFFSMLKDMPAEARMMGAAQLLGAKKGDPALARALQAMLLSQNSIQRRGQEDEKNKLLMEQMRMQVEAQKQAQAKQQGLSQLAGQYFNPGSPGIPQPPEELGGGPGLPATPMGMKEGFIPAAVQQGFMDPLQAMAAMPKPPAPMKMGKSDRLIDPTTGKELVSAAPDLNEMVIMGPNGPMINPHLLDAKKQISAAGRSNVTTNVMPQREVFKDSLGLKKDFDSQPEVKGYKEVRAAWDQIDTALKRPSPANDLAAATKFMKLLDPGSVVRESELVMAMQASGKLDYFLNTADRILKGHKLTPAQRIDFHASGKALHDAAEARYKQTQSQYQAMSKKYGLDADFMGGSNGWKILD